MAYLYLAVLLLAAGLLGFALGWAIDYWVFVAALLGLAIYAGLALEPNRDEVNSSSTGVLGVLVWIIATAGAGALALGSAVGLLARRRDRRRRR